MLEIKDLQVFYGGIHALQGISLEVPEGKIVSLIGANGAGKSTTLNSIVELVKPRSGSIVWNGMELTGMNTRQIVSSGIVLVPEGRHVFPNLTVAENLTLGAYHRSDKAEIEKDPGTIAWAMLAEDFCKTLAEHVGEFLEQCGDIDSPDAREIGDIYMAYEDNAPDLYDMLPDEAKLFEE